MKVLRVIIAMALMLMPTMPFASWMPNCSLSKDKSTLEVIASNPSDTRYHCQAWCRMKISGERGHSKVRLHLQPWQQRLREGDVQSG
jgi:hypothetical protein